MIAAESHLLTYEEAAKRIPKRGGKGHMSAKFIKAAIKRGHLLGTDLGHNCKRVRELDLIAYIKNHKTVEL